MTINGFETSRRVSYLLKGLIRRLRQFFIIRQSILYTVKSIWESNSAVVINSTENVPKSTDDATNSSPKLLAPISTKSKRKDLLSYLQ